MIGLIALAVLAAWFWMGYRLCNKIPTWLGIKRFVGFWQWVFFLLFLFAPVLDHLIGRWQLERLCAQHRLEISPNAVNTKRAKQVSTDLQPLSGYVIPIEQSIYEIIDLDTGEKIAQYNYFTTDGGILFRWLNPVLGGGHSCSAKYPPHPDFEKYQVLKTQTQLTYERSK